MNNCAFIIGLLQVRARVVYLCPEFLFCSFSLISHWHFETTKGISLKSLKLFYFYFIYKLRCENSGYTAKLSNLWLTLFFLFTSSFMKWIGPQIFHNVCYDSKKLFLNIDPYLNRKIQYLFYFPLNFVYFLYKKIIYFLWKL